MLTKGKYSRHQLVNLTLAALSSNYLLSKRRNRAYEYGSKSSVGQDGTTDLEG